MWKTEITIIKYIGKYKLLLHKIRLKLRRKIQKIKFRTNFQYVITRCDYCNMKIRKREWKYLDFHDGAILIYCKKCHKNIEKNGI